MKKNVGSIDKVARIILGLGLIAFALITKNWWGFIGVFLLLTAFMNYCPVYSLLSVSTVQKVKTEKLDI
jgi:hypothetical protein